tara:strand:+ start:36115 stop:36276 length:162 start_codon:yes stop_codon:yes gene_type:complete
MVYRTLVGLYNNYKTQNNEDEIATLNSRMEDNNEKALKYVKLALVVNFIYFFF